MAQSVRLTDKLLDRYLRIDPANDRIKSVNTMPAQNVILCAAASGTERDIIDVRQRLATIRNESPTLAMAVDLMYSNGLRVSELLGIASGDISLDGRILIRGKKRSFDRFIDGSKYLKYLLQCRDVAIFPFGHFNRFYLYRQFKRFGLTIHVKGNSKMSVTHSLRHLAAKSMQSVGNDIFTTARGLGHKSIDSTKHYTGDKAK